MCTCAELDSARNLAFESNGNKLFLVASDDGYFAYQNKCPHQLIPLDWDNGQFLDYDGELIQCATHGALFTLNTGLCVSGPCHGKSLKALAIQVIDANIYLEHALD